MALSIRISLDSLKGHVHGGLARPSAVDAECPHCGRASAFRLEAAGESVSTGFSFALSRCVSCNTKVQFIFAYGVGGSGKFEGRPIEARMLPAPKYTFESPELPKSVPEPLRRSFDDTVRTFNAQIWGSTATSGRRTLEGIFKYLLPEEQRKLQLHQLILKATEKEDFAEPLRRLSHALREGGNLGAHFDDENEPDADMAMVMVRLLNYLIEYLYILPDQIKELEDLLNKSPISGDR